jgi:LysM repeat protein
MKKSNPKINKNSLNLYFTRLFYSFLISFTLIGSDIKSAEAGIFSDTFGKIKSVLGLEKESNSSSSSSDIRQEDGQDFVLRATSKNIVEKIEVKNKDNKEDASLDPSQKEKIDYILNKNMSEDGSLRVSVGPLRNSTEDEVYENDTIQVYEVKQGDTISDIASLYNVSKNTILWANDIKNNKPVVGDILLILPVNGVKHTVKKGDTLKSLSKKYLANSEDISDFNNIENSELVIGEELIIPDGELYTDTKKPESKDKGNKPLKNKKIYASAEDGYYTRPILGGIKTQGLHGKNAVDIGAPVSTTIVASAAGVIQIAKNNGWNGGYGKMIIISHPNGTQSLYAHMNNVYVAVGQTVAKGEVMGESGNTGKSTGPHLHFEIRGARNPF